MGTGAEGSSVTPAPQYLITEDELKVWELCCEIIDGEFNTGTNDSVGKYLEVIKTIRSRPYSAAQSSDKVLDELLEEYRKACDEDPNEWFPPCHVWNDLKRIRQQTKERP
jgi:hypothetical protein